jgi:2-polyprenyl-3-methyl-5-hydroxy-6-metoxy-1,4-benzoquinol methylase
MSKGQDSFLEKSAMQYHSAVLKGWEKLYQKKRKWLYNTLKPHLRGKSVLEMGCADGEMTQWLAGEFELVTVVDGSKTFLEEAKVRIGALGNVRYIHSMFENYLPEQAFDTIMMTHILEHLDDPILVLKRARKWLAREGRILIAVPNANSLHRFVGVKMGMLKAVDSLNEQDKLLGHKRVYTPRLLKEHINSAGLVIKKSGGIMIKPLSNRQIEATWSDELIEAFFKLGEDFPELCSEIYAVTSKA